MCSRLRQSTRSGDHSRRLARPTDAGERSGNAQTASTRSVTVKTFKTSFITFSICVGFSNSTSHSLGTTEIKEKSLGLTLRSNHADTNYFWETKSPLLKVQILNCHMCNIYNVVYLMKCSFGKNNPKCQAPPTIWHTHHVLRAIVSLFVWTDQQTVEMCYLWIYNTFLTQIGDGMMTLN